MPRSGRKIGCFQSKGVWKDESEEERDRGRKEERARGVIRGKTHIFFMFYPDMKLK